MTLDPDPDNQLGKGYFEPAFEASLLAQGVIFAVGLPPRKDKPFWSLVCCNRLIADAVTDSEINDPRYCLLPVT